jgi:hypothetical protein
LTFDLLKRLFSSFFGFFELSFYGTNIWIDSWKVFLIIFLS